MRVAAADLQAIHRAGSLIRYALFGPVAYVVVDLPPAGTAGTGLDEPCLTEHHGIVMRGSFEVLHEDGRTERFGAGTAFYVPPGPPTHTFASTSRTVVCGFARIDAQVDTSDEALSAAGFEVVPRPRPPIGPPGSVDLAGAVAPFRRSGAIEVSGSVMGDWLFMTASFGPRSGYASGWCDLTHWGLVLDGELAITYEGTTELASKGDAYFAPAGHRFATADGVTIADYTPMDGLTAQRVSRWRRTVLDGLLPGTTAADAPTASVAKATGRVGRAMQRLVPDLPGADS